MQSSDFRGIVSPAVTGADPRLRRAGGGRATEKQKPNVVIVLPPPHPVLGALALAMLHHHLKHRQGALQRAAQR